MSAEHAPRRTLEELGPLVRLACAEYGIGPDRVESLRYYNNATYRIDTRDGARFALRLASERYPDAELRSEMWWLQALGRVPEVLVPRPLESLDGRLVVHVSTPELPEGRRCTLCRFIEGDLVEEARMTPTHYARAGLAAARLHEASLGIVLPSWFRRPRLDGAPWFKLGADDLHARVLAHWRAYLVPSNVRRLDELAHAAAAEQTHPAPRSEGLVHADFHARNFIFQTREVGFIDFEDLAWGPLLYDVATALFGALDRADHATLVQAFMAAYCGARGLGDEAAPRVRSLQAMRVCFLTSLAVLRDDDDERRWWENYVLEKARAIVA